MKLLFASEEPTEPVEDPKSPQLAVDIALSPGSEPKAPESGGSSDRILSPSWASASTLIEAADAPPPTVGSSETSAEEEAETDANPEAEEAETQTEQPTTEEVLTAEVEMLRDENAQMREQLEKMHTLLQGQMALMSKAAASLTPPPTPKRCPDAPPYVRARPTPSTLPRLLTCPCFARADHPQPRCNGQESRVVEPRAGGVAARRRLLPPYHSSRLDHAQRHRGRRHRRGRASRWAESEHCRPRDSRPCAVEA